jgi:hypothetical protein
MNFIFIIYIKKLNSEMVSISVVDYIGKVKDGVAIILSINIDDVIYQMIFWFNTSCNYVLSVEEKLLEVLKVKSIYDYEHIDDLLQKIFMALPPVKEIFEKFE